MYKLDFTLKQHTPIIHFQHDQDGVTLRATEVKPKLDRYIIEKLTGKSGKEAFEAFKANAEWEKWLVGKGEHPALDYKMRIEAKKILKYPATIPRLDHDNRVKRNRNGDVLYEDIPTYFANMGLSKEEFKWLVFSEEPLTLSIFITNMRLYNYINSSDFTRLIIRFFSINNFSNRNTKGFGGFSVISDDELRYIESKYSFDVVFDNYKTKDLKIKHQVRFPDFKANENLLLLNEKWKTLFHFINLFHKGLKSGYNQKGGYMKPAIFKYFKEIHDIQWDKKSIKETYFNSALTQHSNIWSDDILDFDNKEDKKKSKNNNLFLVRDLLGLTIDSEWKGREYNNSIITKHNESIDRFASPLIYKPILVTYRGEQYFRVFIFLRSIPDEYHNQSFLIQKNDSGDLILDTPPRDNFSLSHFFEYLSSDNFNVEDLIVKSNSEIEIIKFMFQCLKPEENE